MPGDTRATWPRSFARERHPSSSSSSIASSSVLIHRRSLPLPLVPSRWNMPHLPSPPPPTPLEKKPNRGTRTEERRFIVIGIVIIVSIAISPYSSGFPRPPRVDLGKRSFEASAGDDEWPIGLCVHPWPRRPCPVPNSLASPLQASSGTWPVPVCFWGPAWSLACGLCSSQGYAVRRSAMWQLH